MKTIYDEATDKNIITKQVVINTPTSAHLLPITADEKVIDEIQQALTKLEQAQKQEKLLELYRYLNENTNDYDLHFELVDEIHNEIDIIEKQIKELENEKI